MPDPIVLQTPKAEAEQSLVKLCEELISRVRTGEITEVSAAVIYRDGSTGSMANATVQRSRRIGAVTQLLWDLCSAKADAT